MPKKLFVTLKNEVKDKWSTSEGIYNLAATLENGKSHWLQEGGTDAIWYNDINKRWMLGGTLDGTKAKMFTRKGAAETRDPQEATWMYKAKNSSWIPTNDIQVSEGENLFVNFTSLQPTQRGSRPPSPQEKREY